MKKLVLLACRKSGSPACQERVAVFSGPDDLVVHWLEQNVPAGHKSVPAALAENLPAIRGEHMRWAYDLGFLSAGKAGVLRKALAGGDEPSMWWTSLLYERHPRLSPSLYAIYKLRCLEMLIAAEKIQELLLYGNDGLLKWTLADFCKRAGLRFAFQPAEEKPVKTEKTLLAMLYGASPAPVRALARYMHWWWTVRRKLPHIEKLAPLPCAEKESGDKSATIATYFPNIDMPKAAKGRFLSNYWQSLHAALNAQALHERPAGPHFVRWLFIRFPSPNVNFAECLKLRDIFQKDGRDGLSYNYLEEFLSKADLLAGLGRWFRIWRASAAAEKRARPAFHFKNSRIDFWHYMKEQWRESFQGWRCLERCLQNLAFRRYCEMAGPQRWTLFPLENCPWERMLTLAAHGIKNNGSVIGAQHSTIRPTDFRYFDAPETFIDREWLPMQPDIIGGNGSSAINQWLDNGMPEARLRQIEALRYLYLAETPYPASGPKFGNLPPEPLERPARKRLLVVTSFFGEETEAHLGLLAQCLDAGLLENWLITIKPHPYLAVDAWREALPEHQKRKITVADKPLALALEPGVYVWASNSTTAALEAALKGLPLMVMRPHNDFDLCPLQDVQGLARTSTVEDVRAGLENPRPLRLGEDYLDLDAGLPSWREILDLSYCQK